MTALAEFISAETPRGNTGPIMFPTCPVCVDTMIAAESSVFDSSDHVVSYLWACETCGYGFVTRHRLQRFNCR